MNWTPRAALFLLASALFTAFLATPPRAQALHAGYYNHPDIYGEMLVFSSEGDLWSVSPEGGTARRLTRDPGMELYPRISPDGKWIAFAAEYDGNYDVYVMPSKGGTPERLTWHPYADVPTSWTPDGAAILHHTARSHPHSDRETYTVPREGGVPQLLPLGSSSFAVMAADGRTVAFNRNLVQTRTWKRYGGGLADDIWLGDLETGEFLQVTKYFGNDLTPLFAGGRIYFTSERDGRMNLWSVSREGKDLEQHTDFTDFDVRFPQTDGEYRIVFQKGADIFLYDARTEEAHLVEIQLPSDRPRIRPHLSRPSQFLSDFSVSNDGKKLLFASRGELFNVPAKYGRARSLSNSPGTRESTPVFAGEDEEYVAYLSDETGNYELYRADARTGSGAAQIGSTEEDGRGYIQPFFNIEAAPDGDKVAYADQTGTLYWTGLTTPTLHRVDHSNVWEIREYEWSPDSRFLAYSKREKNDYRRVYIYDSETKETRPVTDGMFDSGSPAWDPEGGYLFFLSARSFNRVEASFEYETIMADPDKIYAILLNDESDNPFFKPDPYDEDDEEKDEDEEEEGKEDSPETASDDDPTTESLAAENGDEAEEEEDVIVEIEFDNILYRQIPFPVDSGHLWGLQASKGRVFYGRYDDGKSDLAVFDYTADKPEEKTFVSDVKSYAMSRNRKHLAYRVGDAVKIAEASADKAGEKDAAPEINRALLAVDPVEEWNQIFWEAYRYNRDYFYVPNMADVDWDAVARRYHPLVERVSIRQELTDLIGNFIGELGHGHTYIWGHGDAPSGETVPTGVLGVDFATDEEHDQIVLEKIYRGERWDPRLESPLNTRRTAEVKEGSYLLEVNGKPVTTRVDPLSHFWGLGKGADVELTIAEDPEGETAKDYRVKLLEADTALRRHEWVASRREYAAAQSDGKIGYVYLPNMSDDGLEAFFREFFPQIEKKALIIDVRWNGGGNVSQKIIRRLNQKLYAYMVSRNFEHPDTYPSRVFTGPMACLINDRAGSDGDIFARSFQKFDLGPLIGERTWGGVVGIRFQTRFVDGGQLTVPEFSFIDLEKGYGIENYGIEPDKGFRVPRRPEDEAAGRDPQLDAAIEYLGKEMKKSKYQRPDLPEDLPDRSTEAFRERSEEWMTKP